MSRNFSEIDIRLFQTQYPEIKLEFLMSSAKKLFESRLQFEQIDCSISNLVPTVHKYGLYKAVILKKIGNLDRAICDVDLPIIIQHRKQIPELFIELQIIIFTIEQICYRAHVFEMSFDEIEMFFNQFPAFVVDELREIDKNSFFVAKLARIRLMLRKFIENELDEKPVKKIGKHHENSDHMRITLD